MPLSWRHSTLADRHRALGSKLEDWSGMGTAWTYDKDIYEEHIAVRTKAGLFDLGHMGRVRVRGPQAEAFLQRLQTNDAAAIPAGRKPDVEDRAVQEIRWVGRDELLKLPLHPPIGGYYKSYQPGGDFQYFGSLWAP